MIIDNSTRNKALLFVLSLGLAAFSFFYCSKLFSDINTYADIVATLDAKKNTIFSLSAATTSASLIISAIPGDVGTPIANQLADISGYLLIILSIIYFEKYLLTIIGMFVFQWIIPTVCLLIAIHALICKEIAYGSFLRLMTKIVTFAIILVTIIPISVKVSDKIDETYKFSINNTIAEIEKNEASNNSIFSFTTEISNKFKMWINNFTEYTAVMIVTSCLIPLATLFVFVWLANIILGTNFSMPSIGRIQKPISAAIQKQIHSNQKISSDISTHTKGD